MIIGNKSYVLEINRSSGSIDSFGNRKKEFICPNRSRPIFTIRFRDNNGKKIDLTSLDAGNISTANHDTGTEANIKIYYAGIGNYLLNACVTIRCPKDDPMTYWRIAVENETGWIIEWIDFPDVVVPDELVARGGSGRIVWPGNEGVLIEDASIREAIDWFKYTEPEYPSRGNAGVYPAFVSTQFMAYYEQNGGLYLGAHDDNSHLKCVEYYPHDGGIRLQFRLYPDGFDNGIFNMDYDMVLGVFDGDWHAAADIYRNWYENSARNKAVPIAENTRLPGWYGESPVVVAYPVRGLKDTGDMSPNSMFPYIAGLPKLARLAEAFDSKLMPLLMHWEGTAPWAPPYVWPPLGGAAALKEFADCLHESGNLLGVYCSGIGWTEQSNLISGYNKKEQFDRENLKEVMCTSPEGELYYSSICPDQRKGYDMCPMHPFTVNTVLDEVRYMIEGGCDYIQLLDQNLGGSSCFCFSKSHGHPPVPGKWQVEAMNGLLERIQEINGLTGKKVLLGCESAAAEAYIPRLLFNDLRCNWSYFIGTPIPLYAYLYHEYANNFMGNQVMADIIFDNERSPDNLLYRIAYAFIAGDMLTVVLKENGEITWNWGVDCSVKMPEQDALCRFIRNINSWRTGVGKEYLHYGKMKKPFAINDSPVQYIHLNDGRVLTVPGILTSCWQGADGSLGQVVVNYTREVIVFSITIGEYAGQAVTLFRSPDGSQPIDLKADINGMVQCSIQPLSAILFKIVAFAG